MVIGGVIRHFETATPMAKPPLDQVEISDRYLSVNDTELEPFHRISITASPPKLFSILRQFVEKRHGER